MGSNPISPIKNLKYIKNKQYDIMSNTIRKGKFGNRCDNEINDFWFKHDSPEDRKWLNKQFRQEEKSYFEHFGEVKYNQKPKSRGWKTH